jgi:hypothetical protein
VFEALGDLSTAAASPRHVHLNGRYTFSGGGQAIDLDTVVQGLDLG